MFDFDQLPLAITLQSKLLDSREDDLAALRPQEISQHVDRFSLLHCTDKVPCTNELVVELIIEVSTVDLDNERRVVKFRFAPKDAYEEGRREGLPRSRGRAACAAIVDNPAYLRQLNARAKAGTLAPAVECMLWHYAKGKPKEQVEHRGGIVLSWE